MGSAYLLNIPCSVPVSILFFILFSFERDFQALRLGVWGDWLMENDNDMKRSLSFWIQEFSIFIPLLLVHLKNWVSHLVRLLFELIVCWLGILFGVFSRSILSIHLKKFVAVGKLMKVRGSYKLSPSWPLVSEPVVVNTMLLRDMALQEFYEFDSSYWCGQWTPISLGHYRTCWETRSRWRESHLVRSQQFYLRYWA